MTAYMLYYIHVLLVFGLLEGLPILHFIVVVKNPGEQKTKLLEKLNY